MSYSTYTNIYPSLPDDKSQEVMERILTTLQDSGFFVSEHSVEDQHIYCEDSNVEADQYANALEEIANEYKINIQILYQSDYSDIEVDHRYIGPNANANYIDDYLAAIKEATHQLLNVYNRNLVVFQTIKAGINPNALTNLFTTEENPTTP